MEGTTVSLTAKAPPIVSTATGSAAPDFNPNDPMSRGFGAGAGAGAGGKKSVTDGLPSHSGSGGGPTSSMLHQRVAQIADGVRQRRDFHRGYFQHPFYPIWRLCGAR